MWFAKQSKLNKGDKFYILISWCWWACCFWSADERYAAFWIQKLHIAFLQPVGFAFVPDSFSVVVDGKVTSQPQLCIDWNLLLWQNQYQYPCSSVPAQSSCSYSNFSASVILVPALFSLQEKVPRLSCWFSALSILLTFWVFICSPCCSVVYVAQPFIPALFTWPSHFLSHEGPPLFWQCWQPLLFIPLCVLPTNTSILFTFPGAVEKTHKQNIASSVCCFSCPFSCFVLSILIKWRLSALWERIMIFYMSL